MWVWHQKTWRSAMRTIAVAVAGTLLLTELRTWRASWDGVSAGSSGERGEIVVVLGFRSSADEHPNFVQRWRTRIALRTVSADGVLLFTGGAVRGARSEASVMAEYAVERGFPSDRILLEEESRTTWENVSNNLDILRQAPTIRFASTTLHARRARLYLASQAPDLAARIRRGRDFRWGEYVPVKAYLLAYDYAKRLVGRRAQQSPAQQHTQHRGRKNPQRSPNTSGPSGHLWSSRRSQGPES